MADTRTNRNYRGRNTRNVRGNTNRNRVSTRTQKLNIIKEADIKETKLVKEPVVEKVKEPKTVIKEVVKEVKVIDETKLRKIEKENLELKSKLLKEAEAKEFLDNISSKVAGENEKENHRQRLINIGIAITALGMLILLIVTVLTELFEGFSTFISNTLIIVAILLELLGLYRILKSLFKD